MKYRKVGDLMISPLVFNEKAYDVAKRQYAEHSDLNFHNDLFDYLQNGFVISRPDLFAMFKAIQYEGRKGWFVRFAVGNILELLKAMPCPLPFLAFCRNNDKNMRIVETNNFVRTAAALYLKGRMN